MQPSLFKDFESKPNMPKKEHNTISLLALSLIIGVGTATLKRIYNICEGDLNKIWAMKEQELEYFLKGLVGVNKEKLIQEIRYRGEDLLIEGRDEVEKLKRKNIFVIFRGSELYPNSLNALSNPPEWLFVQGNPSILSTNKGVALVGTRSPTSKGLVAAKKLAMSLVKYDSIIISGLAEGIDAKGHEVAVNYGKPTIAILGHGLNVIYPTSTAYLRDPIIENGAILSEYLPGETYSKEKFVQRNRLQAALSSLVAVVEGKSKSGTAHTVKFAQDLKKPILGVTDNGIEDIPQHELLKDIKKVGFPTFNLSEKEDCANLKKYVEDALNNLNKNSENLQPGHFFNDILSSIKKRSQEYEAKPSDLRWLVQQIEQLIPKETASNNDAN